MRRVIAWTDREPFLATLVLVVVLAVPGLVRVEALAREARDTAHDVREATQERCRSANETRRQTRELYAAVVDTLERGGGGNEPVLAELRALIPEARYGDNDCDGDGLLTEADYDDTPLEEG